MKSAAKILAISTMISINAIDVDHSRLLYTGDSKEGSRISVWDSEDIVEGVAEEEAQFRIPNGSIIEATGLKGIGPYIPISGGGAITMNTASGKWIMTIYNPITDDLESIELEYIE